MSYISITPPNVGDPTRLDAFAAPVVSNIQYFQGAAQSALAVGIINGSFEVGSGAGVAPSNWTLALASGNSCNIETASANVDHGAQAFSMTTPGSVSGGVSLTTSDYYAIGELGWLTFSWFMKSTVAGIANAVNVLFYDCNKTYLYTASIFSSSTNNTSWAPYIAGVQAADTVRFFQLQLVGVNNATAGTVYWDGVTYSSGDFTVGASIFVSSGTYTPRSNMIYVREFGGGGGGAGAYVANIGNITNAQPGVAGNPSWVVSSAYLARGGNAGTFNTLGTEGVGGASVASIYTAPPNLGSQKGTTAGSNPVQDGSYKDGGPGGANYFGGAGGSGGIYTGAAGGIGQLGAGGGGAGGGINSGAGGASGEYAEWYIPVTPGVPVPVTVGSGGSGGAGQVAVGGNGDAGGSGGSGLVIIQG